jgi:ADP-heptose:LPS heptosyltransferase
MNLAIRVPDELHLKVLSFPFLHAINRHFVESLEEDDILNIHLISTGKSLDVLNMLPFKAYYQTIPEEDANNMLAAHINLGNLNRADVDIYISLTDNFVDTMIGKNLKAKKRIGFSSFKNNLLLHKKIPDQEFEHYSQKIFSLLEGLDDCRQKLKRVTSRKMEHLYTEWKNDGYVFINIEVIEEKLNVEWIDLINHFDNKNIVLMASELPSNISNSLLNDFVQKCSKKNKYKVFDHSEIIDFGKIAGNCDCFVSPDSHFVQYASYCGAQIFHLNREDGEYYDNQYFIADTVRCSESDSYYQDGEDFHYGKFFDEVLNYLNAQIKK